MSIVADSTTGLAPVRGRVRWRIFLLLFSFTFAAYVQRTTVSVAAVRMMPDLHLSQLQIGWLETAFLVSYTALQFPGGVLGQRLGPRLMITLCGIVALVATLAMPILPAVLVGGPLFLALLGSQFVLGAAQAPFFALLTGALERWFPSRDWALTQGLSSGGIGLGAAAAPAAIASLLIVVGWRSALVLTALPVLLLIGLWWRQGRDAPHQHPAVTAEELAELDPAIESEAPSRHRSLWRLCRSPSLIGLTLSYLMMNFAFYLITNWSFLYLVQARGFTILQGGLAAAAPPLTGGLGAALGGIVGSACSRRFGARWGLRLIPLTTLPTAGALLLFAVNTGDARWALAGLSLAFGMLEMNEACFWAAAMRIGRRDAAAAGGLMNTGGNLGGIIATPIVALLSGHGDWTSPFLAGAGFAVLSGASWLLIDPAGSPRPALRNSAGTNG